MKVSLFQSGFLPYTPANRRRFFSALVIGLTLLSFGCESENCVFNSDCDETFVCAAGDCVRPCAESMECGTGFVCMGGICHEAHSDCESEAGCPDSGVADGGASVQDAMVLELDASQSPDMQVRRDAEASAEDAATAPVDAQVQIIDAAAPPPVAIDSGAPSSRLNLDGMYTVNSRVLVSTHGEFEEGQVLRKLVRLTQLSSGRYRFEQYDLDGNREFMIPSVDFTAPEGTGRFQYEFDRRTPDRNCDLLETRFERGRYDAAANGYRLTGSQERRFDLVGDRCNADPTLARLETTWTALP